MRANISKQWGAEFGASSDLDAVLLWQKAITGCVNGECKWPAEGTHRENPTGCVAPSLAFTRFSPYVVPQSSLGQFSSDLQEAGRGQQQPSSLCLSKACTGHSSLPQHWLRTEQTLPQHHDWTMDSKPAAETWPQHCLELGRPRDSVLTRALQCICCGICSSEGSKKTRSLSS